jgi:hypothetical protein
VVTDWSISSLIFFTIGCLVGWVWLAIDYLLYPMYAGATDERIEYARQLVQFKQWRQYLAYAWSLRFAGAPLITRSLWFLLVFTLLAIFGITSGSSFFGFGFLLGTSAWYLLEITKLGYPQRFRTQSSLIQVGQQIPPQHLNKVVIGAWLIFLWLVVLVLI